MSEHKYKMTYRIDKVELTAGEIPEGWGACDATIIHSIIFPPDGSYSHFLTSLDGRTGEEMDTNEFFKAWTMMAATLAKRDDLSPGKKMLASGVWEAVCNAMKSASVGEEDAHSADREN